MKANVEAVSAQANLPRKLSRFARNIALLRVLLDCIVALGLIATAFDAGAEEGWIADKNGCKIANPSPRPKESVTWDGACVDGFADGSGVMQWYVDAAPGPRYEGTVRGGVISGRGKLTLPDGTSYDGEWVNGKQQGNGTLSASDGSTYRGEWKDGEPDGRGTMRSASGEVVRGNWKQGSYLGPGDDDTGKQR